MTSSLGFSTVAGAIANLSIAGVTIRDVDEISAGIGELAAGVLCPRPDDFATDITTLDYIDGSRDTSYNLHYDYFHCAIAGRLIDVYKALVDTLDLIATTIIESDLSGANSVTVSIDHIGPVEDAAGNQFHGGKLTLHITRKMEA